jgi:prepilin-type processing-associated H-X9-DG protein
VFAKAREKARQTACLNNQKQIATAVLMYAQDHEEMCPPADGVWGAISMDKGVLVCPTAGTKVANGYLYHRYLGGTALGEVSDPTTMMVTVDGIASTLSGIANVASWNSEIESRHGGKVIAAFLDGHVSIGDASSVAVLSKAISTVDMLAGVSAGTLPNGANNWTRTPVVDDTTSHANIAVTIIYNATTGLAVRQASGPTVAGAGGLSAFYALPAVPSGTAGWTLSGNLQIQVNASNYNLDGGVRVKNGGGTAISTLLLTGTWTHKEIDFPNGTTMFMGTGTGPSGLTMNAPFALTYAQNKTSLTYNGKTLSTAASGTPLAPTQVEIWFTANTGYIDQTIYGKGLQFAFNQW